MPQTSHPDTLGSSLVVIDWIVTPQNAFAVAERLARKPDATREELVAAACVLCQSSDWKQRVLGKELRMGLYAGLGAELCSPEAKRAAAATRAALVSA